MEASMKAPNPDPKNRRDAAGETTVLISGENNAPASLAGAAASGGPQVAQPRGIVADSGHTRILGYSSSPQAETLKTDPVVAWLVILDGPGKGNFRPIFRGSNTIGRSANQRVPIDFGDDTISSEKQAFLVYDERKRQYQLVPNLERPNLVYLNDSALTGNADLKSHDKVTMGSTTLLFVPLCGADFDWSDTVK
jgi:hypothetical protein